VKLISFLGVGLISLLVGSGLTASAEQANLDSCNVPDIESGQSFYEARASILAQDYGPPKFIDFNSECHPDNVTEWSASYCTPFPEIQACSGTGQGFCKMRYEDNNGSTLTVVTANGSPSADQQGDAIEDVIVVGATISCGLFSE